MLKVNSPYIRYVVAALFALLANATMAAQYDVTVYGSDAIFLAGRTDVVISPASDPWDFGTHMIRHADPTPEEIQETLPPFIPVAGNDVIKVADPAVGGINFYNGYGPTFYGPSGYGVTGSFLNSVDGISGFIGPQGPLVGVFLDDSIPSSGPAPATLDFTPSGLGIDFDTLSPLLNQIFYIGDGVNSGGFQEFIAPLGATRLFLGIADGFAFYGDPGAYDDNDGSYRVLIGVNEIPNVPIPAAIWLFGSGLVALLGLRNRQTV